MIEVTVTAGRDDITRELKNIQRQLRALPVQAHAEFVALTPIDKGNARRKTKLRGDRIVADYVYATRLDEGHSKQAPDGITRPWEAWMQRQLKRIFGK